MNELKQDLTRFLDFAVKHLNLDPKLWTIEVEQNNVVLQTDDAIDRLIKKGLYASLSELMRTSIKNQLRQELELIDREGCGMIEERNTIRVESKLSWSYVARFFDAHSCVLKKPRGNYQLIFVKTNQEVIERVRDFISPESNILSDTILPIGKKRRNY